VTVKEIVLSHLKKIGADGKTITYLVQVGLPPVYRWEFYTRVGSLRQAVEYVREYRKNFTGKQIRILKVTEELVK
jgi:hypothetical protein